MLKKLLLLLAPLAFAAPFASAQTLGTINTIAGGEPNNVPALSVSVGYPTSVARDTLGNIYVGSFYVGGEVFKIDPSGTLTTVAGNGSIFFESTVNNGDGGLATNATLGYVYGLYVDANQNIYIADILYNTVRKVTASTGIITTVAGGGTVCTAATDTIGDSCPATSATLSEPYQVVVDANQNLFIADSGNNRIREVLASSGIIQTVAGGGTGCTAQTDSVGDGWRPRKHLSAYLPAFSSIPMAICSSLIPATNLFGKSAPPQDSSRRSQALARAATTGTASLRLLRKYLIREDFSLILLATSSLQISTTSVSAKSSLPRASFRPSLGVGKVALGRPTPLVTGAPPMKRSWFP